MTLLNCRVLTDDIDVSRTVGLYYLSLALPNLPPSLFWSDVFNVSSVQHVIASQAIVSNASTLVGVVGVVLPVFSTIGMLGLQAARSQSATCKTLPKQWASSTCQTAAIRAEVCIGFRIIKIYFNAIPWKLLGFGHCDSSLRDMDWARGSASPCRAIAHPAFESSVDSKPLVSPALKAFLMLLWPGWCPCSESVNFLAPTPTMY